MLKALIIGADAVAPDYIFGRPELYPNITKLKNSGASSAYSAYVQKGYNGSYLSEMNWSSIYTGLTPKEHKVLQQNVDGIRNTPEMKTFDTLRPFWKEINDAGYSVGLWAADCCVNPKEINGYVVSAKYEMISTPTENRVAKRELQICSGDKKLQEHISRNVPPRLYPRTLVQQGYLFEELKDNEDSAWEAVENYHFNDAIENFREELAFFYESIVNAQSAYPVDGCYFYTPSAALIAHCCMCSDDNDVLIQAYQVLDEFVGKLIETLQPEYTMFLSDHGMVNFKDLISSKDREIQREAFAARDEVLWLKNGYIAFEAHNGALLFTAHALKGTFVVAGKHIKHTELKEMRTVDIYPTLLELFRLKVPSGRSGFVQDIFERPLINEEMLLKSENVCYKAIALIQCHQPSITDIILNELYIENRFAKIAVVGNERYREIFSNNPRVAEFISYEEFREENFEEIYCGIYNETTKEMNHMRIK